MKRHPLSSLICWLVVVFATTTSVKSAERPNIVFLLADDQCTYSMGCYGTPDVKTPNLDRLAREGMLFDNHYDTTAICMASRANVMTGMFEYKTGCNFEHGALLRKHWRRSYPVMLREAGYVTAFAGKFGFEVAEKPKQKGVLPEDDFDAWGGGPGQTHYETRRNPSMAKYVAEFPHSTLSYGAFGRDFIAKAARGDKPFCLSISFKAPHRPVSPDPKFDSIYQGQKFTKPKNFGREHGEHFALQSRAGRQYERFHSWHYSDDYDTVMAKYHQQIYAIDVAVGMIREALEQADVAKNTVVIYTSDNGFFCGAHGLGSKVLPYEEGSRVPLLIYDPRHENSGKKLRCDALTGNVDFAPTILDLAAVSIPKQMDGRSLVPLYDDPKRSIHDWLPLINVWGPRAAHSLAVVTKDWKYIYWPHNEGDYEATEELFHTGKDPMELKNLISKGSASEDSVRMRSIYDAAVSRWQSDAVPYHNYKEPGQRFRRR